MLFNTTIIPSGFNNPINQEIINQTKSFMEVATLNALKKSSETMVEYLRSSYKDKAFFNENCSLVKKLIYELNTQFNNETNFSERELRTIFKIIKKCQFAEHLPKNFTIDAQNEFKTNNLFLASQSDFFAALFQRREFEPSEELKFVNLSKEAAEFFKTYFHTNTLRKIDEENVELMVEILEKASEWRFSRIIKKFNDWCTITPATIMPLYTTACKIEDEEPALKKELSNHLSSLESVIEENYLLVFDFARRHAFKDLEETCLAFFKKTLWNLFNRKPEDIQKLISFKTAEIQSKELSENEKGKEKISEEDKMEIFLSREEEPIHQALHYFAKNLDYFDEKFLSSLNFPELLLLLISLPEKINHLNLSGYTLMQLKVVIPWLPKNLKSLNLKHAEVDKSIVDRIVKKCPLLENLKFRRCKSTDHRSWHSLSELKYLKNLDVRINDFSAEILHKIIRFCPFLEEFKAFVNAPVKPLIHAISQSSKNMKSLELTEQQSNKDIVLTCDDFEELSNNIGEQINNLQINSKVFIPQIYRLFPNLKTLLISDTSHINQIAEILPENSNISTLAINDTIDKENIPSLKIIWDKCPKLENFSISDLCYSKDFYSTFKFESRKLKKIHIKERPFVSHEQRISDLGSAIDVNLQLGGGILGPMSHPYFRKMKLTLINVDFTPQISLPSLKIFDGSMGENMLYGFQKLFPNLEKMSIKIYLSTDPLPKIEFKNLKILNVEHRLEREFLEKLDYFPNIHTLKTYSMMYLNDNKIFDLRPHLKVYLANKLLIMKKEIFDKARDISNLCKLSHL